MHEACHGQLQHNKPDLLFWHVVTRFGSVSEACCLEQKTDFHIKVKLCTKPRFHNNFQSNQVMAYRKPLLIREIGSVRYFGVRQRDKKSDHQAY